MQIERDGKRLSLANHDGKDAFYANLEDYVRLLQDQGANVYLVLGVPVHLTRFNPSAMVARSLTSFRVIPDVDRDVPVSELRADYAVTDEKLRNVARHTGAQLLDPFPDICGNGDGCSPFFGTEPSAIRHVRGQRSHDLPRIRMADRHAALQSAPRRSRTHTQPVRLTLRSSARLDDRKCEIGAPI